MDGRIEDVVQRAAEFAKVRHGDQKRKYTAEPYWHHLRNVARLVAERYCPVEVIAAAWLHDVLEDTPTTPLELSQEFGHDVAFLVREVTDVSRLEHGNRKARKAIDRAYLANASPYGQTIKLADLIDNTSSIVRFDKDFARVYLDEKEALLDVLTRGDPKLRERAYEVLRAAQRELVQHDLGKREHVYR